MAAGLAPLVRARVLLVEDDPGDAQLVEERLAGSDPSMTVVTAARLADGLEHLRRDAFDLILLDLHLPDSQGTATVETVQPVARGTPIVVLSGGLNGEIHADALRLGAAEVIDKAEAIGRCFPGMVLFIVERHRAVAQHRRLAALVDDNPDAMLVVSAQGVVRCVNQAACVLFAQEERELVGEQFYFAATPGKAIEIDIFAPGQDRKIGELLVASIDWQGEPCQLVTVRDVTQRKLAERLLAKSEKLELENRVKGEFLQQLEAVNAALARKNEALERANRTADVLLREVHHRVKNNLQIISSLLYLQAAQCSEEAASGLEEACQRVEAISKVHEHIYRGSDMGQVAFDEYLHGIAENVVFGCAGASGRIELELDLLKLLVPIDTAIPCGLIVNELITNSLKYAFPDGRAGVIRVGVRRIGERRLEVVVADNGVGQAFGPVRSQRAFGMEMVETFAEHLDAEVRLDGSEGTQVTIAFDDPSEPSRRFRISSSPVSVLSLPPVTGAPH